MDLLCNAYSSNSDDEPASKPLRQTNPKPITDFPTVVLPPPKRPKHQHSQNFQREAPLPGRYISKRERALLAQAGGEPEQVPNPKSTPNPSIDTAPGWWDPIKEDDKQYVCIQRTEQVTYDNLREACFSKVVWIIGVFGSIKDSDLPHDILSSLRQAKGHRQVGQIPQKLTISLYSHTKAVNALNWSASHAHLLASAGMDHTVCVWNVWNRDEKISRAFRFHNAAVKDVKWSQQGLSLLSCGYDCSSRLIDVENGIETQIFKEDQVVRAIKFHPDNPNLFLSGGSKGRLRLWDTRIGMIVHEYIRVLGPILDIEFTINGKQFISSSDVSGGNISENSIIVWDVSRQVPLSNQVYTEAYTCPSVRHHPFEPCFVAQSNGNYIAIFSSNPPFKLDKYKRYESHGVSGFPIKCNFSMDGEKLVSGSSDGSIYFYNYRSSELVSKIKAYEQASIDVAFHPVMPNVLASCSWNGDISIYE